MRIWNLTKFDELESDVLSSTSGQVPRRRMAGNPSVAKSFRVAVTVAALATVSFGVGTSAGTSKNLILPSVVATEIAHNVLPEAPPLERLFAHRFDDSWTRAQEEELLRQVYKKSAESAGRDDLVDVVGSNLQEDVDAPTLSPSDIAAALRRRA